MKFRKVLRACFMAGFVAAAAAACSAAAAEPETPAAAEQLFARGNSCYEKGEYGKAIDSYGKIILGGEESGPVYFNLGNAYFKSGNIGRAILSYERAKRLMPRDADLDSNYRFARSLIKGKVIPRKGIWAWSPLRVYTGLFTVDELTWLLSAVYALFIVFLFTAAVRRDVKGYRTLAAVALLVFIVFNSFVLGHKIVSARRDAVIIAARTDALFGPFETATKFFTLNDGMKVSILKKKDDWYKIRRADGKTGWIPAADAEKV